MTEAQENHPLTPNEALKYVIGLRDRNQDTIKQVIADGKPLSEDPHKLADVKGLYDRKRILDALVLGLEIGSGKIQVVDRLPYVTRIDNAFYDSGQAATLIPADISALRLSGLDGFKSQESEAQE